MGEDRWKANVAAEKSNTKWQIALFLHMLAIVQIAKDKAELPTR